LLGCFVLAVFVLFWCVVFFFSRRERRRRRRHSRRSAETILFFLCVFCRFFFSWREEAKKRDVGGAAKSRNKKEQANEGTSAGFLGGLFFFQQQGGPSSAGTRNFEGLFRGSDHGWNSFSSDTACGPPKKGGSPQPRGGLLTQPSDEAPWRGLPIQRPVFFFFTGPPQFSTGWRYVNLAMLGGFSSVCYLEAKPGASEKKSRRWGVVFGGKEEIGARFRRHPPRDQLSRPHRLLRLVGIAGHCTQHPVVGFATTISPSATVIHFVRTVVFLFAWVSNTIFPSATRRHKQILQINVLIHCRPTSSFSLLSDQRVFQFFPGSPGGGVRGGFPTVRCLRPLPFGPLRGLVIFQL